MPDPLCNRKKVRGWKRRIRDVERFERIQTTRDLGDEIARRGYAFTKIYIDPWFRLTRRIPPVWLQQRIVESLVRVHDAWHARLTAMGSPVHTRIWLGSPGFMESQVVGGVGDRAHYVDAILEPAPPLAPFPAHLFSRCPEAVTAFRWECHTVEDTIEVRDCDGPAEVERLVARGWRRVDDPRWGASLVIRVGDIWAGTRVG